MLNHKRLPIAPLFGETLALLHEFMWEILNQFGPKITVIYVLYELFSRFDNAV